MARLCGDAHSRRTVGADLRWQIYPGAWDYDIGAAVDGHSISGWAWYCLLHCVFIRKYDRELVLAGGAIALIGIRALMGLFQGPMFPAMMQMLSVWIPCTERAFSTSFVYSGMTVSRYQFESKATTLIKMWFVLLQISSILLLFCQISSIFPMFHDTDNIF